VQADPIKPTLKPPGTKRVKLEYDGLLSSFGFKFDLRRYTKPSPSFALTSSSAQPSPSCAPAPPPAAAAAAAAVAAAAAGEARCHPINTSLVSLACMWQFVDSSADNNQGQSSCVNANKTLFVCLNEYAFV